MTNPLPPVPNQSITPNSTLTPQWLAWFNQLYVYVTAGQQGGGGLIPGTTQINTSDPIKGGGTIASNLTIGLEDGGVTNEFLASMPASTIKGNATSTPATPQDLTVGQAQALLQLISAATLLNTAAPIEGGGLIASDLTLSLEAGGVANSFLSLMPALTIKGNSTSNPATPQDLAVSQAQALLNIITTASQIGALLYPKTAAENSAGAVITNFTYPQGNVLRYGADPTGVADSSHAFATAFAVKGVVTAIGSFLIMSGVNIDISTTTLVGPAVLTCGFTTPGSLLTVSNTGSPEQNSFHKIEGVEFIGKGTTGVQGTNFGPGIGTGVCCFKVNSCTFTQFADGAVVNSNAFEIQFDGCSFSQSGTDHAALRVTGPSSERVSCVQCQFFNNAECVRVDGGGEIFLDNCSLDYSYRLVNAVFGNVYLTNCYYENGALVGDIDYWFKTSANDSTIVLQGGQISQTATKTAFAFGQSLATLGGGIFFRNIKFFSNTNGIVNPMIAGTGNAFASGCMIDGFSNINVAWANFSIAQNLCSNGTFVNGLQGWTVATGAGSESPTTSDNTLLMQVSSGGDSISLFWTITAQPGQNVGFSCQIMGNTSACRFGMLISSVGGDGVVISNSTPQETFNEFNGTSSPCPTSFTSVRAVMFNLPSGTATVQFQLNTLGATSNANLVTVQNVLVGTY